MSAIIVLILAAIAAAALYFDIVTIDGQKNIHFNVSRLDSLIQHREDSSDVVPESADSTITIMSNTESTVQ